MSYKPRSLFSIIGSLNYEIFLPHIQRPFVWEKQQMSKLLDSLMRGYPVQTMLFWKTSEEIKTRKFMDLVDLEIDLHSLYDRNKSRLGETKTFVLDGQQRIQSLFCLFKGGIKTDNNSHEEAFVDITSFEVNEETGEIYNVIFKPSNIATELPLFKIKDLTGRYEKQNAEDISDLVNTKLNDILGDTDDNRKTREKVVRRNIAQLRSILTEDRYFWIEELDGIANHYPYSSVVEIFVRVNSGGTRLDASDLMFAAMKELSASIEENLEIISDSLSNGTLIFEVETILRGILLVNGKRATVSPKKFTGTDGGILVAKIDSEWDSKYEPAFEALRDFIVTDLKIDNEKLIRSYNSFVPIFEYLFFNPTPNPANKSRLKSFYYRSQLFYWFSAQTDGILDYLHNNYLSNCANQDFPLSSILNYFENRRKRIIFDTSVLLDHSLRFFLLHLLYVETNNSSAFNVKLKNNEPHIDHIYPRSKLTKAPFTLTSSDIDHIGNYRLVGATDNIRKRAEIPQTYFQTLKDSQINIQRHLLVQRFSDHPSTTLLMDQDTYLRFRDERTEEIFKILAPIINYI
jgi:hypothetical protein